MVVSGSKRCHATTTVSYVESSVREAGAVAEIAVTLASLILARILFPQCPAIWRAKSCHFNGTTSVRTAR